MSLILGNGNVTFGDLTVQSTAADGLLSDGYRRFHIFHAFGLFTVPTDSKQIRVRVVGGGGGGGLKAGGGGGGGGGYVCAEYKIGNGSGEIQANTVIPVMVGLGGKTQFNVDSSGSYTHAANSNYTNTAIDVNYVDNIIDPLNPLIASAYYTSTIVADDVSAEFGLDVLTPTQADVGSLVYITGNESQINQTVMVDGSASSFGTYLLATGGAGGGFTSGGTGGVGSVIGTTTALNVIATSGGKGGAGGGIKSGSGANVIYHGGGGGGSAGGNRLPGTGGGIGNLFGGGGGGGIGGRGSDPIPGQAAGGGGSYGGTLNQYGGYNSLYTSNMYEYSSTIDAYTPILGIFPFQIFTGGGGFMVNGTPYNGGVGGGGCGGYIRAIRDATTGDYSISYSETLVRSGSNGGIGGGGGGGSPRRLSKHFINGSLRLRGYGGAGNGGFGGGGGGSCGDSDFTAGVGGNGLVVVEWK